MANIKSQIKRNRQNDKRQARNKQVRSEIRTRVKSAVASPEDGDAFTIAVKRIDKAATKGVIHKNAAARKKSRLAKAIARAS